jgi:hypothetical protein
MRMTYLLIRDHLQQAQAMLREPDAESNKLREVLQLVIDMIDELQLVAQRRSAKILRFPRQSHPGGPPRE